MPEPLPVTDEDIQAFWTVFYTSNIGGTDYPASPPRADSHYEQHLLIQFRRAMEADRKRVAERSQETL